MVEQTFEREAGKEKALQQAGPSQLQECAFQQGKAAVTKESGTPKFLPKADDLLSFVAFEGAERPEAKAEKKTPKDRQEIPFPKLLTDYRTPFIDAYEKSKAAKEGDPGKSPALEAVVDRMKACPWSDQIKVKFDSKAKNPDYDPATSTITINPNDSSEKQIEVFAHEGFHSTNARLFKLYLEKATKEDPGKLN